MTKTEWLARGEELFGKDVRTWRFVCPNCGHIQTANDFIAAGVPNPEGKFYFSCIGRWTGGPGIIGNGKAPCDYTLGGLFVFNTVTVIDNGATTPVFAFAEEK
jgi:hypothetical protein